MQVKPLNQGEVRIFKLLNAGKVDPKVTLSDGTKTFAYNQGATYVGQFSIFDKYEKEAKDRNKILKNVIGTNTKSVDGREFQEEIVGDIVFNSRGVCVATHREPNKYLCLARANENLSNPERDTRVPALWEEMSVVANRKMEKEIANREYEAETIALRGDIKEVMAICEKVGIKGVNKKDTDDLRHDLRIFAKSNNGQGAREIIRNSKNQEAKLKIYLEDATFLRVLSYLDETRAWIWEEDESEIVKVDAGKDPEEVLLDFLMKNKDVSKRLVDSLKSNVEEVEA